MRLDQCALNADGSFKDACEITWHHDPDDETPIASGSKPIGRVQRSRNVDRMAEIINAEQDSDNQHNPKPSRKRKRKAKRKVDETDKDDVDFMGSSSDSDSVSEDDDTDCVEITNVELADSLPSKTIPSGRSRKSKGKKPAQKRKRVVDNLEASYLQTVSQSTSKSKSVNHVTKKTGGGKQNPIYLFYEQVDVNKDGNTGEPGDKHYKCYHGNRKRSKVSV